ncbi:allantoinase AllB [Bacillus sp. Marseille-P3661]|uniref:allantoinase AllB n=1 Tax=Bacillus sp. Marseille-P3661 TaxID=1936234 RepID=UPI000C8564EA|nr:allantoinase AllB [Bacillus sp. Marseille-P3661]
MIWDHIIKNGTIVTPHETYKANIYIYNGKISAISRELLEGDAKEVTDAKGLYVLPGLIDVHVHSRDPGPTHKEDFYFSSMAAAAGGITTIFEMPNTTPPTNTVENFNNQVRNLSSKAHVDFGIWAISLGNLNIHEIEGLHQAGAIGFKFFWGYAINKETYQLVYNYSSDMEDIISPPDEGDIYYIFEEVAKTGKTLAIHAENHELIQGLSKKADINDNSYKKFLKSRPHLAEETTIQTAISFARELGTKLHILHLTTKEGVKLIQEAQAKGYNISTETCPQYLFLTDENYEDIGAKMKVYPLIKNQQDQDMLWEGIRKKVISIVCSDHAPHTKDEKTGDLWSIPAGMCGVETLVPMMIDAVNNGEVTLNELAALLSENPAKQFDIFPQKGSLQVGTDADITIIDLEKKHTLKEDLLHSKSKITAFDGWEVKGMPVQTILRGKTIMKDGEVIGNQTGKFVNPNSI